MQAVDQEMATIQNIFLISIPGALLLVAIGAWLVSGSALRPIRQLTGVIQQVTVKGLDQRIPIGTTDVEFVEENLYKSLGRIPSDMNREKICLISSILGCECDLSATLKLNI